MEPSPQAAPAEPTLFAATEGWGRDTVLSYLTSDGRVVTFLATALIPGRPLRLWGALVETSGLPGRGRGGGVFIRLSILGPYDGWSVTQLLAVALARFEAELAHSGSPELAEMVRNLERAAAVHREAQEGEPVPPVSFEPASAGTADTPFPWTVARAGLFSIPMCPDLVGRQRGVTPEQLLAVVEMALSAWLPVTPWRRSCWEARRAVREVLAMEARRMGARFEGELAATAPSPHRM